MSTLPRIARPFAMACDVEPLVVVEKKGKFYVMRGSNIVYGPYNDKRDADYQKAKNDAANKAAMGKDAKKDLSKLSISEVQSAISRQWGKGLKVKSISFSRLEGKDGETAVYKMTWDDPEHNEKNASGNLWVDYSGGSLNTEFGS